MMTWSNRSLMNYIAGAGVGWHECPRKIVLVRLQRGRSEVVIFERYGPTRSEARKKLRFTTDSHHEILLFTFVFCRLIFDVSLLLNLLLNQQEFEIKFSFFRCR
jgi:hypothetical protein